MFLAPYAEDVDASRFRAVDRPPDIVFAVRAQHPSILYQNFPRGFIIFFIQVTQTPRPLFFR